MNEDFGRALPEDTVTPDDASSYVRKEADLARKELAEIEEELDDTTRDLTKLQVCIFITHIHLPSLSLQDENEYDFGENQEFHKLHGECFDTTHDKYKYSFCPFKDAKYVTRTISCCCFSFSFHTQSYFSN
jgi:hypothetical protein